MNVLQYWFKAVYENLKQNRLMNIVAIGSTAMALMIIGVVFLLQQNVSQFFGDMKSSSSVVLFLEDDVSKNQRQDLHSKIISHSAVSDVNFRSKSEAKKVVQNRGKGWDVLSGLEENPLPASFHLSIKPNEISNIDQIASTFSNWSGVESVDYPRKTIERIQQVSEIIQWILGVFGLIVCLVAIFIIFNTIRLAVISKKDEIDILKLVGATRRFIGVPFIIEGVIQGLMGCIVGTTFLGILYFLLELQIQSLPFFPIELTFLSFWRLTFLFLLGVTLGVIGSASAVYRSVKTM